MKIIYKCLRYYSIGDYRAFVEVFQQFEGVPTEHPKAVFFMYLHEYPHIIVKRNNNSFIFYYRRVIIDIQYYILYETKGLGFIFNILSYTRNSYWILSLL